MNKLPTPVCGLGFPRWQVESMMYPGIEAFDKWMYGQTMAICEKKNCNNYNSGPHGVVVYPWDVVVYFAGLQPLD